MMKKTLGLFLVLFVGIQQLSYAQTGIGTNSPNEQAVLEIQSVDKGVLFPSISLTSTTTFLGGISATASHTNMLVYNTNTATTTTGLDGAGYYFWNGSNWEKITGDTDGQSLAEVTAIGNTTNDVIAVGGVLDSGALTVVGDADLQGNVDLGDTYLDNVSILGTIDEDLLFQAGKNVASPTSALVAVYSSELKPGSGDDLSIDTNSTSERINFSNNGVITAGVNSSTFFVGDISGPNHYKLPSGIASRASGQVLTVDSSTENLYFSTIPTLPASFDDGATLRWNLSATEWEATTDFRIAPGTGYSLPNAIWIEESIIPSSTINLGQSGNSFVEVYADQFISSQGSVTFGTSNGSAKVNLKFDGDPSGSLVLNERNAIAGQNNTAFGYQTFNTAGTVGNNNVAIGHSVLSSSTGTGGNNVGIGTSALQNNTANDNVAIGNEALILNSGGTQNVAVGSNVLDENTSGQYNTAVGYNALHANTTGENNIAIGKSAMADNISGQKNIAIGTYADVGASDLENAIAIGYGATVNSSNTLRLGNDSISSIISSGTLTLDGATYPNTTGTAGQVLTVSSTTNILYFADAAGSSTTPTLDQITTTGSQTNNSIQVGALTVSSTTGLSIKNGSDRYFLPTTQGTAGQSLIVSTTTTQLVFTSHYYFLAKNLGGQVMANGTVLNNFSVVSSNGITIASGQNITLPQGRIYELSAALNISDDTAVGFGFYDGTNFLGVNGVSSKNGGAPQSIPARAIIDATSSSVTIKLAIKSVTGTGYKVVSDGTHIMIKEL